MLKRVIDEIGKRVIGKDEVIERILIALLCDGHVLIEDVPGVGKTTIAKSIAEVLDLNFSRIQFTPDLMPGDVLGYSIYNRNTGQLEFIKGPVHSHIVLADEINRTSPKTQSSLLEAMEEKQVTIEGHTYKLESPFLVIATQNPIEFEGTFPLPEAQLDRFLMKLSIGYPKSLANEMDITQSKQRVNPLTPQLTRDELLRLREQMNAVHVDLNLSQYITTLVRKTRENPALILGASPRGTIALHQVSKAEAFLNKRDYVIPDDVMKHIDVVLGHRLILRPDAKFRGVTHAEIIKQLVQETKYPE